MLFIKTAEKGGKNLAQTHAVLSDAASKIDERGYPFYQSVFASLFDTVPMPLLRGIRTHNGRLMEFSQLVRSLLFFFFIFQSFHSR